MAVETILTAPIFIDIVFPFVLVFVLIFAILQKTNILGEDKPQINAIISLAIGILFIAFPYPRGVVQLLMPFLAVAAVVILVFMILFGFVASGDKGFVMNKGLKITFGILIGIALIIAILAATGYWKTFIDVFTGDSSNTIVTSIIFIAIIGGAMAVVLSSGGEKKS